ncbi:hypothetical protein NXY56_001581 [Leishmania guyanensis]
MQVCVGLLNSLDAPELDVRKEAVWPIGNVVLCRSIMQVHWLLNLRITSLLYKVLRVYDPEVALTLLEELQRFL